MDPNDSKYPDRNNLEINERDDTGRGHYRKKNLETILRVSRGVDRIKDP